MDLLKTIALALGLVGGLSVSGLVILVTWQAIVRVLKHWDVSKPLPPLTEIGTSGLKFGESVNKTLEAVAKLEGEAKRLSAEQLKALEHFATLDEAVKVLDEAVKVLQKRLGP
jgi:hypothetical protein